MPSKKAQSEKNSNGMHYLCSGADSACTRVLQATLLIAALSSANILTVEFFSRVGQGALPSASAAEGTADSAVSKEMDLETLLNKIFLAYGGKEGLAKLSQNSLSVGQQKILDEDPAKVKTSRFRILRKSGGMRIDLEGEGGWKSTVYDGLRAWRIEGKTVTDLEAEEVAILSKEKDRELPVLTHFGEPEYKFTLRGSTLYKAVPVYAIEVSRSGNEPTTIFVDKKNYQVLALSYDSIDASKKKTRVSIDFEEYRPSGGTVIAFKQVQHVDDVPVYQMDLQSVELGVVNDEDPFRRPDRPNEVRLDKPVVLPFVYSHKEIVVKASVNGGEPVDFLFDTGSTQTLIDRRLAAENMLDKQAGMNMNAAGGMFFGQATDIQKLGLGELSVPNVQAVIVDLSAHSRQLGKPIAGVIGVNVLNRFAVTIDYGKSQISFRDFATYKAPAGANVVPFNDRKGPVIKIQINAKEEVPCLVDTGAAFNNLPHAIAKKYVGTQTQRYTEGVGVDGRPVKLGTLQIASVKIGTGVLRDVAFTYSADPEPAKRGIVANSSNGILGNPFWQNFVMTIDYRMRQIILQANPTLASRQQLEQLVSTGDSKLNIYRDYRSAEQAYQQALQKVQFLGDPKQQARLWGRLGNLRRIMAKDLNRPEQSRIAYEYFSKGRDLAHKMEDREIEGRILADWALLYMDNNQMQEALASLEASIAYAPQDPQVNVDYAVYLNKMRRYGDMRYYIDKALFLEPSNWQALFYRLKLCEQFNDLGQAKETLKEILKYYPWSKVARDKYNAIMNPGAPTQPTSTGTGE
ncbi:MAG: aspartyl protease family protein [Candidatus Obscuribacterales bacterium]|jgi:predicted aspartyl protease|nr:aspartyl protease family protein [Candidatus Obscuribacterales bacterium]